MNYFDDPHKLDTDSDAEKMNEPMLFLWGGAGSGGGNAFWTHKDIFYPNYMEYDTTTDALDVNRTGLVQESPGVGQWKIIQGAESPINDETVIVGIAKDGDKEIRGKVLIDPATSFWVDISVPTGPSSSETTTLLNNELKSTDYWSIDVKYESQSGRPVIAWSNGIEASTSRESSGISFTQGTGQSDNIWTIPSDLPPRENGASLISLDAAKVKQIRMASNPKNDEIVLIASNENNQKFAVVWSGSAWADAKLLADGSGDDSNFFTDVNVAYMAQSGEALVVFGDKSQDSNGVVNAHLLRYASFDGTLSTNRWGNESVAMTRAPPTSATFDATASAVRWTRIASDPRSNRIIVGVLTDDKKLWTAIWDADSGDQWENVELHTIDAKYDNRPQFSVAFESFSQKALVIYSDSSNTGHVLYKTFDLQTSSWSSEESITIGTQDQDAVSLRLTPDPSSNEVMLMVEDHSKTLSYTVWDGSTWTNDPTQILEEDTDDDKKEPFLFLYDQNTDTTTQPSSTPSNHPSQKPTVTPSYVPTTKPSQIPSKMPSTMPSLAPSGSPSRNPSSEPSSEPSTSPSSDPSSMPSVGPSLGPTVQPSDVPSSVPSSEPSTSPSSEPSSEPSSSPSSMPSVGPSLGPTVQPSDVPSSVPSSEPSTSPSSEPSSEPSSSPSSMPSVGPSLGPTVQPSDVPSSAPSSEPSSSPSSSPSSDPSSSPSSMPSPAPTIMPEKDVIVISRDSSKRLSLYVNGECIWQGTDVCDRMVFQKFVIQFLQDDTDFCNQCEAGRGWICNIWIWERALTKDEVLQAYFKTGRTFFPSSEPSSEPSLEPSLSSQPSSEPSTNPSLQPSDVPSGEPSNFPSSQPSSDPSTFPSLDPSSQPSSRPSSDPSIVPSFAPNAEPSSQPSSDPSTEPSLVPRK